MTDTPAAAPQPKKSNLLFRFKLREQPVVHALRSYSWSPSERQSRSRCSMEARLVNTSSQASAPINPAEGQGTARALR